MPQISLPYAVIGRVYLTKYATAYVEGTFNYNFGTQNSDHATVTDVNIDVHSQEPYNPRPYDAVTEYDTGTVNGNQISFGTDDNQNALSVSFDEKRDQPASIESKNLSATYNGNNQVWPFQNFVAVPGGNQNLLAAVLFNAVSTKIIYSSEHAPMMTATFKPNFGLSVADTAALGGFTGFNWTQRVDHLTGDSPFRAKSDPGTPLTTVNGSFPDPVKGEYTYQNSDPTSPQYQDSDPYPFYLTNKQLKELSTDYSVSTRDLPADPYLKPGEYISFTTDLVGIMPDGTPSRSLYEFQWYTTFNGTVGGTSVLNINRNADPGSGEGVAEITSEKYPLGNGSTIATTITGLSNSGDGIDGSGNGDLGAGKAVTLTLTTSEGVTVTPGQGNTTPTLSLSDGGTAAYTGPAGQATSTLTFSYTVLAGQNTADLAVTGSSLNGATVRDAAGNDADLAGAVTNPPGTLVIDTTPPTASSVTDTVAQGSGPTPIGLAAPSDNLGGSLAIAAGALPSDGTITLADGSAVGTGDTLTAAQLSGLLFTPMAAAGANSAFTYTVADGAGNSSTGTATLNVGPANTPTTTTPNPTPAPDPSPPPTPDPTPTTTPTPSGSSDTVSLSPVVTYKDGVFTLTGAASGTAGVKSVEISAMVDGVRQNLGAATLNADGTFSFQDAVTDQQTFFQATLTDGAGGQATSADPGFNLSGGLGPRGTQGRQESFSPTEQVSSTLFRANGTRQVSVEAPGQTVALDPYDTVFGHRQGGTTFVYTPGGETGAVDVIRGFKARGADHDVLSLKGADFGNSIANVLRNTGDVNGSAFVTDPVTGDSIRLAGVSTAELSKHPRDFTFHA